MSDHAPHILLVFALVLLLASASCSESDDALGSGIQTSNTPEGADGKPCIEDDDCNRRTCLRQSAGYPDGLCTSFDCQERGCDGEEAVCAALWDGTPACLVPCEADGDCREGYVCQIVDSQNVATCLPRGGEVDPAEEFAPTRELLGFDCEPRPLDGSSESGPNYQFSFTLSEEATSFLIVPTVEAGTVLPLSLTTPAETVDLRADYRHHNARLADAGEVGTLDGMGTYGQIELDFPILFPYAPQFAGYVHPGGNYELTVTADEQTPCLYVLEGRSGADIDLNIYLVGAGGRTADDAAKDDDLQAVFSRVDQLFGLADVGLGQVRYFDVPAHVREAFRVVRSQTDAYKLTAYGAPPDQTRAGHLSVDLFLVDDMQLDGADVLGLSAGLPGAAGLHGNARNGLVFQTTDLGIDNDHVAHIVAHEVGHFLGLRHTTEVLHGTGINAEHEIDAMMGITDPIEDTPECETPQRTGFECPDAENLMFPAAPPPHLDLDPRLSADQQAVFRANPLIK